MRRRSRRQSRRWCRSASPFQREVTDYAEFTGQTKGIFSNEIIPQVTGYLVQMPFVEGAEVKKGDLLFEVDPRPYKAQLDQAQGQVDLNKASLRLARTNPGPESGHQRPLAWLGQLAAI